MPRRSDPHEIVRAGTVAIPIYRTAKGFTAKWTFGGEKRRADRVRLPELRDEMKRVAASIANGDADTSEAALRRDLEYYRQLEQRLGGTPLHVAVDAYLAAHRTHAMVPAKVEDLIPLILRSKRESGLSSGYLHGLKTHLEAFRKRFGTMQIHEVQADAIREWLVGLEGEKRYQKNVRGSVVTFFCWARDDQRALPLNSKTEAELVAQITVKRKKALIYSPEEMRRMLAVAPKEVMPLLVLGGFCGIRMSEITGEQTDNAPMQVEAILWDFDHVRVSEQKVASKGDRLVPLPKAAKEWLLDLKEETGPVWKRHRYQYHLTEAARKAGVVYRRNGFRKSWITYRMAIVKNANQVADEAGNSPGEIYRSYRRPELAHVAEEWFSIFPTR